jgi:hypothetical protein
MTVRHHVHHVHSGWPSPYVGVIAAGLFALAVAGFFGLIALLAR